jgi:hypothetical protein
MRPLQRAQPQRGIRGEHGDLFQMTSPLHELVHVRGVGEGHLLPTQRGHTDHRARATAGAPGRLGLGEQI